MANQRIKDLPPKVIPLTATTIIPTEDPTDESNKTKGIPATDLKGSPFTWGVSDEDSPLTTGIIYTTEAGEIDVSLADAIITLKNAPTGGAITVDIKKETGVNTNVFNTIFTTALSIDVGEFTSQTAAVPPVILAPTWEAQRRLQISLVINDTNFIASGLKVTLVSS